ncbi:major facilitator superfamily protein [Sarocladium implicatum]|nr:major facilitator superfamily protein [Sarocladium implicatum]
MVVSKDILTSFPQVLPIPAKDYMQQEASSKGPQATVMAADEETPLLQDRRLSDGDDGDAGTSPDATPNPLSWTVLVILLIGELLSHADTTLIFAAAPQIASHLGSLRNVGWLATSYTVGVCAMQPLYGKLSDIFGRKQMLLFAYIVLSAGCTFCALSRNMVQIILARILSGVGGAGVMIMSSIIITDSVPRRDFAKYRSYINLATTLGRSIGGPIGGLVADTFGWPWLFWGRLPLFGLSILLVWGYLENHIPSKAAAEPAEAQDFRAKWAKIDFKGAVFLAKTIVSLILLLDSIDTGFNTPPFWFMFASVFVFGQLFVYIELFAAQSPIFDLRILARRNVALSYLVDYLQVFSQVGMMFSVPLYFQVTQRASAASSGARIVPAVVGNTIGALISGRVVKATRHHGLILVGTGFLGVASYTLIFFLWDGDTSFWESSVIIGGGLATGIAQSVSFVTMASHLDRTEVAMATSGFFLVSSLGTVTSVATSNVLLQAFFGKRLRSIDVPDQADFIDRITSDIGNINKLTGLIRDLVVDAFVRSLKSTYLAGIAGCLLSAGFAVMIRD